MSFDLATLGWDDDRAAELRTLQSAHGGALSPARVSRVDRAALTVLGRHGAMRARPSGQLFHHTGGIGSVYSEPVGTPAVGDWVALDGPVAVAVLRRRSAFERGAASGEAVAHVVAANVDIVFVVLPLVGRPRPRLVQRCLALAWQSGATPVVLLTKKDLSADVDERVRQIQAEAIGVDVHAVSAATGDGLAELMAYLIPGRTVAMIGPSGAGKSTLTNALGDGSPSLATSPIRADGKGRHTTTARELVVLPRGAIAIDTPGLRGLALWKADDGIASAFADVEGLAADCRFADCHHRTEPGCAVTQAIENGDLTAGRLADYDKLRREQRWLEGRRDSRVRARQRAQAKTFFRAVRNQPHR
jgi:ribosome biogenesis GTPase / thiamine phosphate phosphatase